MKVQVGEISLIVVKWQLLFFFRRVTIYLYHKKNRILTQMILVSMILIEAVSIATNSLNRKLFCPIWLTYLQP